MMQQKAASLSSSLFAHKGKASPASLLISELEAAGAESFGSGGPAAAANGRAGGHNGRRKPKPPAELPLLDFVEAQAAEEAGGEDGEAATAAPAGEPAPAASLLEGGARSLRRANGGRNGLANGLDRAAPPAAEPANGNAAAAGGEPQGDAAADPAEIIEGEIIEAETVSGDANVAAIEDAPQDDDGRAEAPAAEAVPADPVTVDPVTVEADVAQPAAAAAPNEAAAVAAPPAAPAMPASLALRQAAARHSLSSPPSEAAPLPPPRAPARAWRSAAALALGAVLGLGLYLALTGEPASPPVAIVAVPPAGPEPEATTSTEEPEATTSSEEPEATTSTTAPEATASSAAPEATAVPAQPPAAAEMELPEPSFDIIRIEPDGQSIIAGRAAPGSEWILLNNDSPIAAVRADANGEWVVLPDAALVPGANAFSLVPKAERGRVSIPAPAAAPPETAPAEPAPAFEAAPPAEPRADAATPALPRPKPQGATAASLAPAAFQAAAAGAYEVQLASVRQSADANRERLRLAAAHPKLLGAMDLRVQEARLDGAGVFYRVRSGAIGDLGVARDLCRRLEAAGQGCLVVRRPEAPASDVAEDVPDAATAVRQQAERPR